MNKKKSDDPIALFETWLAEAENSEPEYPEAVCLATADAAGRPSARMVLLKAADARGFVFYTNLSSRKGHELRDNPHAALCFHWKSLRRQVRVEGPITPVDDQEADAYFASRPRLSQIGAWASRQSQPMTGSLELEKRVAQFSAKFHITQVPRPDFWSGFRLAPQCIEFWREATFRLHERIVYRRHENAWHTENLFP